MTEPRRSLGTPAPFTPDQVEALVRGQADETEIARVLESHSRPRIPSRRRRAEKTAPVPVSEKAITELRAGGATPPSLVRRLEAAAKRDKPAVEVEALHERPSERPPRPAAGRKRR